MINATFWIEMHMYYFWIRKFYKMTCICPICLRFRFAQNMLQYCILSFSLKRLGDVGLGLLDKYDVVLFVLFWWSRPCLSSSCGLNFICIWSFLSNFIFFAGNFMHADKELGCEFAWKIFSFFPQELDCRVILWHLIP